MTHSFTEDIFLSVWIIDFCWFCMSEDGKLSEENTVSTVVELQTHNNVSRRTVSGRGNVGDASSNRFIFNTKRPFIFSLLSKSSLLCSNCVKSGQVSAAGKVFGRQQLVCMVLLVFDLVLALLVLCGGRE